MLGEGAEFFAEVVGDDAAVGVVAELVVGTPVHGRVFFEVFLQESEVPVASSALKVYLLYDGVKCSFAVLGEKIGVEVQYAGDLVVPAGI